MSQVKVFGIEEKHSVCADKSLKLVQLCNNLVQRFATVVNDEKENETDFDNCLPTSVQADCLDRGEITMEIGEIRLVGRQTGNHFE